MMGVDRDLLNKIIAYEDGAMGKSEVIDLFKNLIDTGIVWELQGHYGRMAMYLIDEGLISERT